MSIFRNKGYLLLPLLVLPFSLNADDLLDQNDFENGIGLPWHISESAEENSDFKIENGKYIVILRNKAEFKWDVQIRHRGLTIESGHTYTVKFKVKADKATKLYAKIGQQDDPYDEYWNNNWNPFSLEANKELSVSETFTAKATDATCEFAFHFAGELATSNPPITFEFDDIYLSDPQYTKPPKPVEPDPPIVRVNQVGYLPKAKKRATVVSSSSSALDWVLKKGGTEVTSGKTSPKSGTDAASGDKVHIIDFSDVTTQGEGYTLSVGSDASHPFTIADTVYQTLRKDAAQYFYHNRSGIEITTPYCGRSDLARRIGHPKDVAPTWPGLGQENYELDVTGGWYDAGDHGKYVVNGGISIWTMMMQYERALGLGKEDQFADGTMNIPENKNKYPDILDEARWQMEFILKMQVPEGKKMAGMAHHKIHDSTWTALGVEPADDPKPRFLRPVSTAATLNLAAAGAQASRLWKTLDETFAEKCLVAAEKAWAAALKNPTEYAPLHKTGGGPYNDDYVKDEFYWAACELYITTGKSEYLDYLKDSPHYLELPVTMKSGEDAGLTGCFTWGSVQGCGTVSLALAKDGVDEEIAKKAKAAIVTAADKYLENMESEGYLVPIKPTDNGYPWGSNSFILNIMIIMGLARDISGENQYLDGISECMDYILGRNPLDKCYVTGYGEKPLENPHHRFWAYQSNKEFPKPPAGVVSGGPNSGLQDPWVQGSGWKGTGDNAIPPMKCFMDHIESWSTNEVTINWNAPLAWATAYLDENKDYPQTPVIRFNTKRSVNSKFAPAMELKKNGLAISLGSVREAKVSILTANGRIVFSELVVPKTSGEALVGNSKIMKTAGLYIVNIETAHGVFNKNVIVK
ncbi:MAG: cellulase [Fibrobacter sp.]|nr:cellulase [Fibrobacter sp.]